MSRARWRWPSLLGGLLLLLGASFGGCTCGTPCENGTCPEGQACSLAWDQCLDVDRVFGTNCFDAGDCHRGICLTVGSNLAVCTGTCEASDPPCPEDWACIPVDDGAGGALPVCSPAGPGAIGEPCTTGNDCQGALCLPLESGSVCSATCEASDLTSCGEGNVGCVTFADGAGNTYDFCVAGGSAPPGTPCSGGITDCDLSRSATCLEDNNGATFCSPACPGGDEDCGELPGGCCVDLGSEAPAPFCLTAPYCGCVPSCLGAQCGDDGCGGSCGTCETGEICSGGVCTTCTPQCDGLECGDDGCGGVCGTCSSGERCVSGLCEATCTPDCTDRTCGDDGCGGVCGTCTSPQRCHEGGCVEPALLLVDLLVENLSASPAAIWGLGEYQASPSLGPPVTYGQGPQPGTTQVLLCGNTVLCSDEPILSVETGYGLKLGYDLGAGRVQCSAAFTLHAAGAPTVVGGDCLVAGGGPFATLEVGGTTGTPTFTWTLP
ncbi:MAG: hypothetical protein P1V51_12995 [Deltaproteobacteria bacterium]|nr:hypothetical protein [Deltaproteobacteria bacterium]